MCPAPLFISEHGKDRTVAMPLFERKLDREPNSAAMDSLETLAGELQAADPSLTSAQAMEKALLQRKDLYSAYLAEKPR
jgi:hypothetical protein